MYLTQALKRTIQVGGDAPLTVHVDRARTWAETGTRVARDFSEFQWRGRRDLNPRSPA